AQDLLRQVAELKRRVDKLEGALAGAQDTHALEERIVNRLGQRPAPAEAAAAAGLLETGRRLLPGGLGGRKMSGMKSGWLIPELYAEFRAMFWMFLDPRYRLSW